MTLYANGKLAGELMLNTQLLLDQGIALVRIDWRFVMRNNVKDTIYEGTRRILNWQMQITVDALELVFVSMILLGLAFLF